MVINLFKPGRLGNQLFLYAHLLAYAKSSRQMLLNPAFDYAADFVGSYPHRHLDRLQLPLNLLASLSSRLSSPLAQTINLGYHQPFDLDSGTNRRQLAATKISFTRGWLFRCPRALNRHANFVRRFFRPAKPHQLALRRLLKLRSHPSLIGLHIRRGDYRRFNSGKYFYSHRHYHRLSRRLLRLFPGSQILLVSDEPIPADLFTGGQYLISRQSALVDLYILAKCDYIVGPPSTFSMWASFVGQKPLFSLHTPKPPISLADFSVVTA